MWQRLGQAGLLVAIFAGCLLLTTTAAALALRRPSVERLETSTASQLKADYSADPAGTRIAPLDPEVIDVAAQDEEELDAAGSEGGKRIPIAEIPVSDPEAAPTPGDKAPPPASGPASTPTETPLDGSGPNPPLNTPTGPQPPTDTPTDLPPGAPTPTATHTPVPTPTSRPLPNLPDLKISKGHSADPVYTRESFSYKIEVGNGGTAAAQNVPVTDVLPANFTITSVRASNGSCLLAGPNPGSQLVCNLGPLAPAATAAVTITGYFTSSATTTVTNTATVDIGDIVAELDESNNVDSVTTRVIASASGPAVTPAPLAIATPTVDGSISSQPRPGWSRKILRGHRLGGHSALRAEV